MHRQPEFYEGVTLAEYNDLRARNIINPYGFAAEPLAPAAAPDEAPQTEMVAEAPASAGPAVGSIGMVDPDTAG